MMTRRLGYASVLALTIAPLLMASATTALSQSRQRMPPRGEQPSEAPPPQQQEKQFPMGASWSAISFNGKPISNMRATLQVDANLRGTGFAGCNTFSASAYPLRQQGFAVGPIALTKRSCDKGVADFERNFLVALRAVRNWDLVQGRLVLKGAGGELTFDRAL